MSNPTNVFEQLTEDQRGAVAVLLRCDENSAGFRNLLRDTPALEGNFLTVGDFARAVHRQIGAELGVKVLLAEITREAA